MTLSATVLDTPDPRGLARFYATMLEADHVPPVWPAGPGDPRMQAHLDVAVDDLDAAVEFARSLGATLAEFQPQADVRVMLDPAGHPFCLYLPG